MKRECVSGCNVLWNYIFGNTNDTEIFDDDCKLKKFISEHRMHYGLSDEDIISESIKFVNIKTLIENVLDLKFLMKHKEKGIEYHAHEIDGYYYVFSKCLENLIVISSLEHKYIKPTLLKRHIEHILGNIPLENYYIKYGTNTFSCDEFPNDKSILFVDIVLNGKIVTKIDDYYYIKIKDPDCNIKYISSSNVKPISGNILKRHLELLFHNSLTDFHITYISKNKYKHMCDQFPIDDELIFKSIMTCDRNVTKIDEYYYIFDHMGDKYIAPENNKPITARLLFRHISSMHISNYHLEYYCGGDLFKSNDIIYNNSTKAVIFKVIFLNNKYDIKTIHAGDFYIGDFLYRCIKYSFTSK